MIRLPYNKSFIFSLLLHGLILLVLLISLSSCPTFHSTTPENTPKIIQATTVSNQTIKAQQHAIEAANRAKIRAAHKKALEKKRAHERAVKQARRRRHLLAEKKAAAKKAHEKIIKREAEHKAKLAAKRKKELLAKQIATEKARLAKAKAVSSEIDQYTSLILATIKNHVYKSICAGQNLSSTISVHLDSQGNVLNVHLIKSSGNTTFDRMTENAVRAAAPFSMPTDADALAKMKQLNLLIAPCGTN